MKIPEWVRIKSNSELEDLRASLQHSDMDVQDSAELEAVIAELHERKMRVNANSKT